MRARWPQCGYVEDRDRHRAAGATHLRSETLARGSPLRVVLIGTDFEVRVWETLLSIPMGRAATYSDIAAKVSTRRRPRAPSAPRSDAIRSCFVVPCHRVVGKNGDLTGYHWGLTRKRAMLGWEAGKVQSAG